MFSRLKRGSAAKRSLRTRLAAFGLSLAAAGALVAAGSTGASAQRGVGVDRRAVAQAERYTGDRFRHATRTPRGAQVLSVNPPRAEMLRAIDDGLSNLFAVARRHGYRRGLSHADYTVFIARADRQRDSGGAYSPDVAIGAAQYAGSVYDRGGYVYAAGIVSSFSPMSFIVAEHERDFGRVADVVRYEGEHLVLYHNDQRRYRETYDHSRGGGHPILQ
jgi:hypothetical protein